MGIEPTFSAWEADVLPLNYARVAKMSDAAIIQTLPPGFQVLSRLAPASRNRGGPGLRATPPLPDETSCNY